MIIAVNARLFGDSPTHDSDNFVFECLSRITVKYPEHQFIYINDKLYDKGWGSAKNITPIISGAQTKNPLRWQYWLNYKMPALLKKYKADVLINLNGCCSLRTKVPQYMLVPDLSFLQYPQSAKKRDARFFKKFTPLFLAKAKNIATTSSFFRSAIIEQYKVNEDKVEVTYPGIDEIFKPISQDEKEKIKEKYTAGKEYFLFAGNIGSASNLLNLLKAFSFFKKRQKSNMMLLIAGKPGEQFIKELSSFKFRNEVLLLQNLSQEELWKITATAYALVHPVLYDASTITALRAMQCEVPVISSATGLLAEYCADAALYCDPRDFNDIAEKMMLVFKDENKARELIEAGKTQSQQYKWDKTAGQLWDSILKTADH